MKKILITLGICSVIMACNSADKSTSTNDTITPDNQSAVVQQSSADTNAAKIGTNSTAGSEKGKLLISQSDCLGCHKLNEKLVGPAYSAVAKKYEANEDNLNLLATKIINGGAGAWGEVPMSPHPSITQDDAKEMVKYILSL